MHTLGRSSCSHMASDDVILKRGINFTTPIWRDFESPAPPKGLKILESYNELCSVCNSGGCKVEQRLSG